MNVPASRTAPASPPIMTLSVPASAPLFPPAPGPCSHDVPAASDESGALETVCSAGSARATPAAHSAPSLQVVADRSDCERACRDALSGRPTALLRFDRLLAVAQRYAVLREQHPEDFESFLAAEVLEFGIPAVVGTGDATSRLHTGQLVRVDGGAGTVAPIVDTFRRVP